MVYTVTIRIPQLKTTASPGSQKTQACKKMKTVLVSACNSYVYSSGQGNRAFAGFPTGGIVRDPLLRLIW